MAHTSFPKLEAQLRQTIQEAQLDYQSFQTPLSLCDLSRCCGMCCHDGVFVGKEEQKVITELLDGDYFEQRGGKLKTRTIASTAEEISPDSPPHFPATRCVFLDHNHHCQLQKRAMDERRHPWFWKPFPCWLHPMTIFTDPLSQRPVLTLPSPENDPQKSLAYPGFASATSCGKKSPTSPPAWMTLQSELQFLSKISGRDLLAEIRP